MDFSIYEYLKYYKDLTFKEEAFNEVDNVILSLLAYVELDFIFKDHKQVTIKEASDLYWSHFTKKETDRNITSVKKASYLLKEIATGKRYQPLKLKHYVNEVTDKLQFGAIMIYLPNDTVYVSYEGTDHNVIGWKEDCQLSYMFPIPAQRRAVEYINRHIKLHHRKVIVGGHSKGGNLALVASMYCRPSIRKRIIKVYSNDGPGLREKEFQSMEYKEILPKFKHFIPRNSLVGLLLNHDTNYIVVDSSARGLLQHDATSWKCYGSHFIQADLKKASRKRENSIEGWLNNYTDEEREKIVDSVFNIFETCGITDLRDIKNAKLDQVLKKVMSLKNIDETSRKTVFKACKELFAKYISPIDKKIK